MKLLSATVRNYRLHRDTTVAFDGSRTLIGGPNEAGKSTLIEAIHRGLFLKATVTGEAQKSMQSSLFPGHPEVEIRFAADGDEYHLIKRFSGGNGTAQLAHVGGATLQGDAAESRLAQLLGVEEPGGGRGVLDRVSRQWAHLWVWQGMSGADPAVQTADQQTQLLQQLQRSGGTVAMQSELDGKVAARFSDAREQTFIRGGNPRAGSDLDKAQAEMREAEQGYARAEERLGRLQQAMSDYESADATFARAVSDLEELRRQRQTLNEKLSRVSELQQAEKEHRDAVSRARDRLTAIQDADRSIKDVRTHIVSLKTALKPKEEQLSQSELRLVDARKGVADSGREYEASQVKTRDARLRRDLAAAHVSVMERRARTREIETRLERVHVLQKDIEELRRQQSEFPALDQKRLGKLQKLENELAQAEAAMNAMAAEIEVVSADQAVRVGGQEVEAGRSRTIAEPADVRIGDAICLRIHPGGGDSLTNARTQVRVLRDRLQGALDEHGIETIARASEIVAARAELQRKIDNATAALDELDADETDAALSSAKDELAAAEAEVVRRLEQLGDFDAPGTPAAAKALRDRLDDALQDAEAHESSLKGSRDSLQRQASELDEALQALRESIAGDRQSLTGLEAQLKMLLESHGDDTAREAASHDAGKVLAGAEENLSQTCKALQDLQPEMLETDRQRLERAMSEANRQREDAQTAKAVCQSTLRSDGSDDPKASLAQADARLAAAREHYQAVHRKAMAIALVDDLFQQQQQALADRFSRPLADKITGYLQCLFGPDTRAAVRFEDNAFKAIDLVRSSQAGAAAFSALSGGTREQVAAGVRLAIAELLAAEHEGSLPVVFDDAFAYSDPQRVHVLQRMLDLGATRGLQIIVLTCNPSDYTALGARQVILSPDTSRAAASSTGTAVATPLAGASASPDPVTEEDAIQFMSALNSLGGKSGNQSLRDHLGWDDTKYGVVKDHLVAGCLIVPGKGRGGSVAVKE